MGLQPSQHLLQLGNPDGCSPGRRRLRKEDVEKPRENPRGFPPGVWLAPTPKSLPQLWRWGEAEINPHGPKSPGNGTVQGGARPRRPVRTQRGPGPGSPCPREAAHRGSLEGEEAEAARLRGGENKTGAGESPDLSSSDPQGLPVNGDS